MVWRLLAGSSSSRVVVAAAHGQSLGVWWARAHLNKHFFDPSPTSIKLFLFFFQVVLSESVLISNNSMVTIPKDKVLQNSYNVFIIICFFFMHVQRIFIIKFY